MRHVIVGTAGHIDHGKTALVRALTGIDTDRLEEEKRRGITIDLGFAHLEQPSSSGDAITFGFIDVPGHEKFVRNMLAGVGGIDMVLLIIAADEGIKPQTREHFDICRMLNIQHGITVLTKSDNVDADTLEVVRLEVEEFLSGSFLDSSRAPIVAVSAIEGTGLDRLKQEMVKVASATRARNASSSMRLPIDRVFTMKGFGTVVTGTMISGSATKEDELELLPIEKTLRVRGVQVHGSSSERAEAGQRTALNLAGVSPEELSRGMTLASPGLLRPTKRIDVSLSLLSTAKVLKDRARVHLHSFTHETIAEVVLVGGEKTAKPGTTFFAQLRAVEPVSLLPGDRFIVRQFSPVVTIGGGTVLDVAPVFRRIAMADRTRFLLVLQTGTPEQALIARVARRGLNGLPLADAAAESGQSIAELSKILTTAEKSGQLLRVNDVLVTKSSFEQAMATVLSKLKSFHDANRLVAGIGREELREQAGLGSHIFDAVLRELAKTKQADVSGEIVKAAGRSVAMKDDESQSKKQIEDAFAKAGLKVPALKDVLASLKLDRVRAQQIVTLLLREKTLVKLSDDLVFHKDALDAMRKQVAELKTLSPKIDVAKFKDALGISRKYAIPLLEYLDRERVTRRVGDERIIL